MRNFCEKCGRRVDPETGLCPACDMTHRVHMEQVGKNNKKSRKVVTAIVAVLLCVALIASGTFVGLGFLKDKGTDYKNNSYNAFTEGFTDISVTDEKSAVEAVASVADTIGIEDAEKDLKVISKNTVDGDSYYRMQQYYNGIPVYGKTVVVSAGEDGTAMALTTNSDFISGVDTEPSISEEEAIGSVTDILSEEATVSSSGLTVYETDDTTGEHCLAYIINVYGSGISDEYIVSADDGRILSCESNIFFDTVRASGTDNKDKKRNFNCEKAEENLYYLADYEKGLSIFNAEKNNVDYKINRKDNCIAAYWKGDWYMMNTDFIEEFAVRSNENSWSNEKSVALMANLNKVYEYFYDNFNIEGFNGNNGGVYALFNDNYYGDTGNAYSLSSKGINSTVISMCSDNKINLDTVAHEYTHSVIGYTLNLRKGEAGAINEAYADIMGELVENDKTWVHGNRKIAAPLSNSYPNYYKGKHWIDTSDKSDNGGVHRNSTVISHCAYLMWNGIDGTQSSKIPFELLGKIWYRSLMLLQDNADFAQCRNAVEMSARIMMKNGQLTEKQYRTVVAAFEKVGIDNAAFTCSETVKNRFELSVVTGVESGVINADAEVVGFNLDVIKTSEVNEVTGKLISETPRSVLRKKVTSGRETLELDDGVYILRITDLHGEEEESKTVNVKITVDGNDVDAKDELVINTDFTPVVVVVIDGTSSPDGNANQLPSPEFIVDIYMADKSLWLLPSEDKPIMGGYAYCFIDLDFDGVLELIRCVNDGSGKYSYNNYYRVSPENLKVEEFKISADQQMGGIDYYTVATKSKLLKDNFDGRMFYVFADFIRDGSAAGAMIYYENYMKGTVAHAKELYGEYWGVDYSVTPNQEKREYTFGNSDVSEAEYNQKVAEFYDECTDLNLVWKYADGNAMEKADDSEKRQLLLDAYKGFSYDGFTFSGAVSDGSDIWKIMPDSFIHTSGAGGWATYLTVNDDGSFTGEYHDSDMGDIGEGYPNGTVYICEFKGEFTEPEKINEYTYLTSVKQLINKENAGTEYIENGVKYICREAIGLSNANEIYIYLPGAPLSDVDETFMTWSLLDTKGLERLPDDFYGIFNVNAGRGFVYYDN